MNPKLPQCSCGILRLILLLLYCYNLSEGRRNRHANKHRGIDSMSLDTFPVTANFVMSEKIQI